MPSTFQKPNNQGIVKIFLLIILLIVLISMLKIKLVDLLNYDLLKENLAYAWSLVVKAWDWLVTVFNTYLGPILQPLISRFRA